MADTEENTEPQRASEAAEVARIATKAADHNKPGGVDPGSVVVTPYELENGARGLDIEDFEWLAPRPRRLRGEYRLTDLASFQTFVEQRLSSSSSDGTTIWIDDSGRAQAVFNDAEVDGSPGWRDYRAVLELEKTPEWRFWMSNHGEWLSQEELSEHVEDGIYDIVEPDGAVLHEMIQEFHASSSGTFRSKIDMHSNSIEATYDEVVDGSTHAQGKKIQFPREFLLAVAPFVGEEMVNVRAKLRFRVYGGKLALRYNLERPEQVERDAIDRIRQELADTFPDRVYRGRPAATDLL